jgi:hypothetical protein
MFCVVLSRRVFTGKFVLEFELLTRGVVLQRTLGETFEKCSILFEHKEGENFNHRNILNISRIET